MSPRSLPNLDLLRSLAVTLVVLDHVVLSTGRQQLGPFSAGWIGVSGVFLFFVHTSLVLMGSLERKPHTLDFYIRRVFRIYPLALVAVAMAALTHAPVGGTVDQWFQHTPLNAKVLLSNALLIQNLTGQPSVINVLWSLPLEVQMYILLPALFFLVRSDWLQKQRALWALLVLWLLVVAIDTAIFPKTALNLATAIPLFLPGVMAYVGFGKSSLPRVALSQMLPRPGATLSPLSSRPEAEGRSGEIPVFHDASAAGTSPKGVRFRPQPSLPSWLFPIVLLLLLSGFWFRPSIHYGWVLALLIGLLLPLFRQIRAPWAIRSSHAVAKYSYGVYLIHPFALVLGFYLLPGRPFALQLGIALLATAAGSVAAYHAIEKPLIDFGARLAAKLEVRYERGQASA